MKTSILAVAALSSAALAFTMPARAANLVVNGSFESTTATDKGYFVFAGVTGWSGGANSLTFLDFPGTADDGSYLSVYPGLPATSPNGGNFVEGDGDPNYSGTIYQTINGLIPGHRYDVSFYQAAGQQDGFTGPTTETWAVSLGDETRTPPTYHLPQGGVGQWQFETLTFTPIAASEVLAFLAFGTPNGAPPISFLDGVSMMASPPPPVPEPAAWALMLAGFGIAGAVLRRRAAPAAVVV